MKRTPIALCLVSLAFAPAQAAGSEKPLTGANCLAASAALSCLEATALSRSLSTPPATARAVLDLYHAQSSPNNEASTGYRLAEAGLESGVAESDAGQTRWRFDAVSELRSLWGGSSGGAAVRMAQAVSPEQLDNALADHMAQRDFWNKAQAASDGEPVGVPQKDLDAALAALLEERASWGRSPSKRVADYGDDQRGWNLSDFLNLRAMLGGGTETAEPGAGAGQAAKTASSEELDEALKALLAQRAKWAAGEGDSPADAGQPSAQANGVADGKADAQTVAGAEAGPVAQADIRTALDALLSERASWGTAPWDSPAPKAAEKHADGSISPKASVLADAPIASLPTADLESLLRQRALWGEGPEARKIAAPLAAGATFPLPKQERKSIDQGGPEPIIYAAEITPVAKLNPVPAEDIDAALAAVFEQRKAWAQSVAPNEETVAAEGSAGSMVAGLPTLSTSSLDELLKQRAQWGPGDESAPVEAPLAAGAEFPLPKAAARRAVVSAPEPIVHAANNAPVPELTPIAPAELATALKALLEERASWGREPTIGDGLRPYASLSTSSLQDLLVERAKWGAGAVPAPVSAPLAAGAVVPLPKQEAKVSDDNSPDPIVHAAEITPPVKLTEIEAGDLAKALKLLLAERADAAKARTKTAKATKTATTAKAAAPSKAAEAATAPETIADPAPEGGASVSDALAALLKERASWGKAPTRLPERKTAEAKAADEPGSVPAAAATSDVATNETYASLSTESLSDLLQQRARWGGQDAEKRAVVAPAGPEAKPAPTQTGALAPYETAATACGRELASILSAHPIEFGPSSAAIGADSRAVLKEIGELARSCPGVAFRIEGHTDASGTAAKNQILSEARARSVMTYLVSFGIEKSRLSTVGLGETKPITDNDTAQNRAKNRRIEFVPVIE